MNFVTVAIVIWVVGVPGSAAAQFPQGSDEPQRFATTTWVDDLNFLSANALLGGITAGVVSHLRHGSFSTGFTRGALGGAVAYGGKRTAAAGFAGAGFLGRQLGAVGGSITRNAALDIGLLDTLILPVGPLRLLVDPSSVIKTRVRLDLEESVWLVYGLSEERLTLDWGRTLSSGAPVFRTNARLRSDGNFVHGVMAGGTITLSRLQESQLDEVFAHERVHIVQRDFLKTTTGLLAEDWVRSKVGLDRAGLVDHLIAGIAYGPFEYLLFGVWGRARDFREVEADFLEVR